MADIYGQSDAALAQKAANTYAAGVPTTLDQINKQIAATSAELEAKIKVGLTDVDKADIASRLDALKTQATQAINNTRSNYDFAQQQNALSGQATQQSMADIQNSQAALAAQALGMTRTSATPGGYAPQVSDYLNLSSRTSAADLAATGGERAVPAGAQVNVPSLPAMGGALVYGPQAGLAGLSQVASTLFSNTLQGSAARAKSDIEQQQLNLGTQIEQNARDAATAREQAQRDALQSFILQQKSNLISTTTSMGQDLLKLQASAANADTRTGKQKAQAELDMYVKKSNIDQKKALALTLAQAKASGATAADLAQIERDNAIARGAVTPLGQTAGLNLANLGKTFAGGIIPITTNPTTKKATKYLEYDNGLINIVTVNAKGQSSSTPVSPGQIVEGINAKVGYIMTLPEAKRKDAFKSYFNDPNNGLGNSDVRQVVATLYGNPNPADSSFYYNMITQAPKTNTAMLPPVTTKPMVTNSGVSTSTTPSKTSITKAPYTPKTFAVDLFKSLTGTNYGRLK